MLPYRIGDAGEFVYSAPNAEIALAFALRWEKEGRYQFFRGQENSEWKPYPSLLRVPNESRRLTFKRVNQFAGYAQRVSRAVGIHYSVDDALAVAQHYGLPTAFLDLTTDPVVAGMFACPPGSKQDKAHASILLYAQSTIDLWISACRGKRKKITIELLRIDVNNLWRLQAQRGLFFFNPVSNFCEHFMPDRLMFPHPPKGFVHSGYDLYPTRKSPLELQLDLYFQMERADTGKKRLGELGKFKFFYFKRSPSDELDEKTTPRISTARARLHEPWLKRETELHKELKSNLAGIPRAPLRTLPDTYRLSEWKFLRGELWPHESWFGGLAGGWLTVPVEIFAPSGDDMEEVVVDLHDFRDALPCGTKATALPLTGGRKRDRDLRFSLEYAPPEPGETDDQEEYRKTRLKRFGLVAEYLWTGLRRTPASADLIDKCLSNFCAHASLILSNVLPWDKCYGRRNFDHSHIEYSPIGGHSRKAKVLCTDLAPAVRSDFAELVDVIVPERVEERSYSPIDDMLYQMIYPQYVFEFEKFAEAFIAFVLPYEATIEAIWRDTPAGLSFNPRLIKIFGQT